MESLGNNNNQRNLRGDHFMEASQNIIKIWKLWISI